MEIEQIEFNTIREDFSEYEAENGQILRVKQVITSITNHDEDGKKRSSAEFKLISLTIAPTTINTSNLKLVEDPNQITEKDVVKEIQFTTLKEVVNIYETKNALILVIPHMQKIFLTDKKDKNNAPHLRFTLASDINIIQKTVSPPNF